MRIEKFENMTSEKFKGLTTTQKYLFRRYEKSMEYNYPELAIDLFPIENESFIKEIINQLKEWNIDKFLLAEHSTALMKYLYLFQNSGCRLGKIVALHTDDEPIQSDEPVFEIYIQ